MNIFNIFWDVNDTLFDTHPATTYAFSKSLNEMGRTVAMNVIDDVVRQSGGDCVMILSQRYKLDPDRLHARFREIYRSISPEKQPPFPGAREICETIHLNGGLNIVITCQDQDSVRQLLEAHQMSTLIDDIFSASQGYPGKPNPAMVLAALAKHSLNPAQTLLIGNSIRDILAGQEAGVCTCLFGGAEPALPADLHIDTYSQLLNFIRQTR